MLSYAVVAAAIAWVVWKILRPYLVRSPLVVIPGPARKSVLSGEFVTLFADCDVVLTPAPGNLEQLFDRDAWGFHDELAQQYGPIVKLNAVLGVRTSSIRSPACHSVVRPFRTNGFTSSTLPRYAASSSRSRARTTKSPGLSSASPTLAPAYSQPILIDV